MNPFRIASLLLVLALPVLAQRQAEVLNRGVVAVRKSSTQIYVSWRLSSDDPADVAFNLYRTTNGLAATKLNAAPLTTTTDFTDAPGSTNLAVNAYAYHIRPVIGGVEQAPSEAAGLPAAPPTRQYLSIPLRGDTGSNGPYDVKFAWVGDLDGDGDYDFVVDRLSTAGAFQQYLEAYTNDGIFLWRMAMGPNSVNQAIYEPGSSAISIGDTDNVTVYDVDGDGRAEVLVRTANGVTVTNAAGAQVASITAASNSTQFLSVINGQTGAELARATMPNAFAQHGTLTNKAMIAYLDGKRPSVVMYGYNRADSLEFYRQFTAFDFRNGSLTQRWTLPQDPSILPGAEGHQIRIADVDNDGKDEICDLGHVIDDNGTQLFTTELTHGDRFHIADINPERPGLETFAIQQYNPTMMATAYYEAANGKMIRRWYSNGLTDVGRGIALDIASAHRGLEMYSTQPGIYNAKAEQIYANNVWAPEGLWWDGDLGREFIDGAGSGALSPVVNKFNASTGNTDRMYTLYTENGGVHQAFGGRPTFWGDILGDWREEIVLCANDFSELRIYTTTTPATGRIYSLMQNPQYRLQATTKGYVQASYVDYFLGYGMSATVPPAATTRTDLTWNAGAWDNNLSTSWKNNAGGAAAFSAGSRVLFDLSGAAASPVVLAGPLAPGAVTFFNPSNYTLDGSGGSLTGAMPLAKSGRGALTITGSHPYSGATVIWDGALVVDGQLTATPVTVWGGTWGGAAAKGETGGRLAGRGTVSQPVIVEYRGAITPGNGMSDAATLTLGSSLTAKDGATFGLDLATTPSGTSDRIAVAGNLTLSGTVTLHLRASSLAPGTYTLLTYGGTLTGSVSNLAVTLPDGTPYTLAASAGSIRLTVPVTRAPGTLTWTGGNGGNVWDINTTPNWTGSGSTFVAGDQVTFNATGTANPSVTLNTALPVGGFTMNAETSFNFLGPGSISGSGGLVKSGGGTLTLSTTNNYSGVTAINGGVLAVNNLADGGLPSSIGSASAAAGNLVLNGGTLRLVGPQTNTNRSMTIGAAGGTISIPDAFTSLQIAGSLTGNGKLTKADAGVLILAAPNTYTGGTLISGGTVLLASDNVNVSGLGSGLVTLDTGTLSMTNSIGGSSPTSAWSINIPAGSYGRLNADGRSTLSGALTGGGTFTFYTPYVRTDLTGNWAAFSGRIFVLADADGGDFRIMNPAGYPAAAIDLGSNTYAYYNSTMGSNLTMAIGTLSGSSSAVLLGGPTSGRTLTWQVGGRNEDSNYAGGIANSTGPTALTKIGSGTLTLTGALTYSGATTVSAGRLQMNGSTSATNYIVENGGTLGGTGTIAGNVTILTGGALEHRGTGASALAITGNLSFGANAAIRPAAGVTLQAGTYTVITYSGTLAGTPTFTWDRPAGSGLSATFDTSTAGIIKITLSESSRPPGPIYWTGSPDFNWDSATKNWTAGGTATAYQPGDTPFLTDSGNVGSAINLVSDVQPLPLTVSSSQNYTLTGSGLLTGGASLVKSGSSTFTLTGRHTFTGGSLVTGGILAISQSGTGGTAITASVGTGPIALSGGGNFRMASSSGKNFPDNAISVAAGSTGGLSSVSAVNGYSGLVSGAADSTLDLSGPLSLGGSGFAQFGDFRGTVSLPAGSSVRFSSTSGANGNGGAGATFLIDGTVNSRNSAGNGGVVIGALIGSGSLQGQTNTPSGNVVYHIGAKNLSTTFSGAFANGSNGTASINKLGSGNLTLSGTSTHTGTTTVSAGKLTVTGTLGATPVTVAASAALGGNGTIGGSVACNGTLDPGGTLTLGAGLTLGGTSGLDYDLGTASDRTSVTGNLVLDGTLNVAAGAGFASGTYTLINYTGTLTNNVLDVAPLPAGYSGTINTATAGQVRLVVTSSNSSPQITAGPTATPTNVTATTSAISVTATDDGGEPALTYTWSASGPAAVGFSPNATNAAKSATATFSAPGSYSLTATVRDASGLTAVSSTPVSVTATATTVTIDPPGGSLAVNESLNFTATVRDQFGAPVNGASFTWTASGGGTISASGVYTATTVGGPFQVTATSGGISGNATVTVTKIPATVTLGSLAANYDGTAKAATATTSPAGLAVVLSYGDSSTPPTEAGSYPVTGTVNDPTYAGSASGTLVITRNPLSIIWNGGANPDWNISNQNWKLGSANVTFAAGDSVAFTDAGISPVNLPANVQPAVIVVDAAARDYSFSGTGVITGSGSLVKSGTATLTLSQQHTFEGGMVLNAGTLLLGGSTTGAAGAVTAGPVGTGTLVLGGGTLGFSSDGVTLANPLHVTGSVVLGQPANFTTTLTGTLTGGGTLRNFNSGTTISTDLILAGDPSDFTGTIEYTGSATNSSAWWRVGANNSTTDFSQATLSLHPGSGGAKNFGFANEITGAIVKIGELTGSGTIQGAYTTTPPTAPNTLEIGAKNSDSTFSGVIGIFGAWMDNIVVRKMGTGTLTLSGANSYYQGTQVNAGKLLVTGSLAAGPVTVATGATLAGTGTIGGLVASDGTLAPGVTTGTLRLSAGLTLASGSSLAFDLGTASDRIAVTGNLALDGTLDVTASPGFTGGTYTLISYSGLLVNNILTVGRMPAGYTGFVSTTTSGEVQLVVVPVNLAPQIVSGATASDSTVSGESELAVSAADDGGEENLIYTWSATGPGPVTIYPNGANSAKAARATFTTAGSYTFEVVVSDKLGRTATSSTTSSISKGTATITLGDLAAIYDGMPKPASATTDPAGLTISMTYSGSTEVPVTPGTYNVTATVEDPNYEGSAAGSLVISPRTFEDWEDRNFTAAQISAGESAATADPDGDGLRNLAEFAMGGEPYVFTAQPAAVVSGSSISLTFQRPAWLGDVTCHAQYSDKMNIWSEVDLEILNPGADPETVRATVNLASPRPAKSFIRLRFQR